jgi:hypothetical protein
MLDSPGDLFILSLPRLNLQALVVHFMDITSLSHIAENVLLEIRDRVERVRHILVLLYISDDFGGFGPLGEVDEIGVLNDRCNAVFDEGEIGKIHAEKRNAGRICLTKLLSVFAKVLGAGHKLSHHVQGGHRLGVDLIPCSVEPMDRRGS